MSPLELKKINKLNLLLSIFFKLPEKVRFVLVGGFNTIFGFSFFALLYSFLYKDTHYLIILILSNFVSIMVAFFMLKFFVFKTKCNYLGELFRCFITYLTIFFLNSGLLYLLVDLFNQHVIISQFFITIAIVILSYMGHKHFSFKIPNKDIL